MSSVQDSSGTATDTPGREADRLSGPAPERQSYGSFASFEDPDGNGWLLQEITTRLPGREDPDWPAWYAEYMVREQAGQELPT